MQQVLYVEVIEMILSKGGNFVLPVKGNQKKTIRVHRKGNLENIGEIQYLLIHKKI